MADTPSGNFDWVKIIAGIGPNQVIKVLNTLRSSLELGINFLYPYAGDNKKMKFTITGLKLAKYLVTVLGSNIKKVTWDGDDVELAFQGGSRGYLAEDVNESEGNYDSINSAVSVIDKVGPLNSNAPYIVEFKSAPKSEEWANFMISCQGLGGNIQISDLYTDPTSTNPDQFDLYWNNQYSSNTAMDPNSNGSTFTPVISTALPGAPCYTTYGEGTSHYEAGDNSVGIDYSGSNTDYLKLTAKITNTPPGYYVASIIATADSDASITTASQSHVVSTGITGKKAVYTKTRAMLGGGYHSHSTAIYAFRVTQSATDDPVFNLEFTGSRNINVYQSTVTCSPISQAQYAAIPTNTL